jgi:hypothetical protein
VSNKKKKKKKKKCLCVCVRDKERENNVIADLSGTAYRIHVISQLIKGLFVILWIHEDNISHLATRANLSSVLPKYSMVHRHRKNKAHIHMYINMFVQQSKHLVVLACLKHGVGFMSVFRIHHVPIKFVQTFSCQLVLRVSIPSISSTSQCRIR